MVAMAEKKYDGFPKFFSKDGAPNRVANTPVDQVNLEARGYKVSETKAAQKVADESQKAEAPKPSAPKSN